MASAPPPPSSTAMPARRRRVVLHFDLNRTVLMSDAAGGRSMENTVNYLLAECAWGRADADASAAAATWHCVSTEASVAQPSGHTDLVTYKQFVDDALPYQSLADTTPDRLEAVKAFNKAAKKQRTALQSAFTAPGSPGEALAASFALVMDKLHFPEGEAREAAHAAAAALPEGSRLQEAWREGRYYLLPSFLLFLAHVAERNASPTSKVDIRLVFRTFGDDIPEVAKEIELLADGAHPFALPGGAPLPAQYKLSTDGGSDQVGTFYRDAFGAEGSALAVGSLTKVPFVKDTAAADDSDRVAAFYQGQKNVEIVRGFDAIDARVREMSTRHATLALRDYWEWWSAHAEHGEYGKLLLVDASEEAGDADVAVFLDDHIEAHHAHIVDVRDVASGEPVAFEEATKRRFLQRVEPFAAITDDQYFIKLLAPLLQ